MYNNIWNRHSGDVLAVLEFVEDVLQLCEEEGGVLLLEDQRGPQSPNSVISQYHGCGSGYYGQNRVFVKA